MIYSWGEESKQLTPDGKLTTHPSTHTTKVQFGGSVVSLGSFTGIWVRGSLQDGGGMADETWIHARAETEVELSCALT